MKSVLTAMTYLAGIYVSTVSSLTPRSVSINKTFDEFAAVSANSTKSENIIFVLMAFNVGFFAIFLSAAFVFILLCGGPVAIYVCIKYKICSGGGATDNNELAEPLTTENAGSWAHASTDTHLQPGDECRYEFKGTWCRAFVVETVGHGRVKLQVGKSYFPTADIDAIQVLEGTQRRIFAEDKQQHATFATARAAPVEIEMSVSNASVVQPPDAGYYVPPVAEETKTNDTTVIDNESTVVDAYTAYTAVETEARTDVGPDNTIIGSSESSTANPSSVSADVSPTQTANEEPVAPML